MHNTNISVHSHHATTDQGSQAAGRMQNIFDNNSTKHIKQQEIALFECVKKCSVVNVKVMCMCVYVFAVADW